jgi:2-oxoacid:acceptor oxidoreductase gamma subunit (pyruvate/2-ketoisovalerate family)
MLEVRFHGRGGQGVVILSKLVARLYFDAGKHVKEFPKFGVERRGAPVEGYVRVDDEPIDLACQIYQPDMVVVMAESILDQVDVTHGMPEGALIVVNTGRPPHALAERLAGFRVATVDASSIAVRHGLGTPLSPIANTALFGAFARLMGFDAERATRVLEEELKVLGANVLSCREAFEAVAVPVELPGPRVLWPAPTTPFKSLNDLPDLAYSTADARANRTGAWRSQRPTYVFKTAPCNARCPAGNDVRGFLEALAQDRPDRALEVLLATSPFPGVCGRVCPHPCEDECNRAPFDGAVAVRAAERFAEAHGGPVTLPPSPDSGKRVAIVGAGPAGLSAAWRLVRLGHRVVVYEAAPHPGGMLLLGIPSFRLPREVLRREVSRIVEAGVTIRCGVRVGTDVSLEELMRDNDAVLLAIGQQIDRAPGIPGEDLHGVEHGLPFLRRHNLGSGIEVGRKVVVVGGGNTAVDVAGVCLRESPTGDVAIVYRRGRAEMPAIPEEVGHVLAEGARLIELRAPVALQAAPDGRVAGVVCDRMELADADGSGRPRPVAIPGTRHLIPCDQIVFATGQATQWSPVPEPRMREDRIHTDRPGLFVCGDASTGEGTVAGAIGSGRRAAETLHEWLGGARRMPPDAWAPRSAEVVRPERINLAHFAPALRSEPARLPIESRLAGHDEVIAEIPDGCAEAARCLSCGTCTGCDNCYVFCPEPAIGRSGGVYAFDLDYCKGCGICFEECPRGVIDMVGEA